MKKKTDPIKLHEWDSYKFDCKLSELIAELQAIVDKYPNAVMEHKLDWDMCYYEGDSPDMKFIIHSKQPKV